MPSMIRGFAESTISRTLITRIMYGGTPVAASYLQRFKEDFPLATVFQIYGLTETNAATAGFGEDILLSTAKAWSTPRWTGLRRAAR
ncbi:hypothetical protein EDD85DRAFT_843857 [Armillaria nabsnona]|nr:hypothetical protein EDD85DRAFT_843857 [Armillaria nabsnona]